VGGGGGNISHFKQETKWSAQYNFTSNKDFTTLFMKWVDVSYDRELEHMFCIYNTSLSPVCEGKNYTSPTRNG